MVIERATDLFLRLKNGVTVTRIRDCFLVGLPTHGIFLTNGFEIQLVRNLDGSRTVRELAANLYCSVDEIYDFAELLLRAELLDLLEVAPTSSRLDLSSRVIGIRSEIERSVPSHRARVRDGGVGELTARQGQTILISGENRLGRHLLIALQASGFTNTRLVSRLVLPPRISGEDICGIVLRCSDIGKLRSEFTAELIRNAQIERGHAVSKNFPDLIISTIPLEWDYVQRWMSEGSVHLQINQIIGREIELGPLVLPGVTPCLRCISLTKRDNGAITDYQSLRSEAPSAAAAYLSGLIALAVAEFFATGQTPLIASSHWYDLLNPLRPPEVRHWNFHPECGCR